MTLLHSTRICSWERRWTTTTGHAILRSTRFRRGIYRLRELLDAEATSTKDKVRRGMSTIVAIVAENISVLREARFLFLFPLFGEWRKEHYAKGEVLCTAGEPGRGVWILVRGTCKAKVEASSANELNEDQLDDGVHDVRTIRGLAKAFTGCGVLIGGTGVTSFESGTYTYTIFADADVDAFFISKENTLNMLTKHAATASDAPRAALALFRIALFQEQKQSLRTKMVTLKTDMYRHATYQRSKKKSA